ncbi:MAG: nitroreductase [Nitrospirales bacterium]|nr:nitroreductase [Nitrospirales bacterium]
MSIRRILESAILAPSGDNCQPWEFFVEGDHVNILNVPARDTSLFNFRQRASLIAHGALIENMVIASSALGFETTLKTFPDRAKENFVASVELQRSEAKDEPLFLSIARRETNRKVYKNIPLTEEQRKALLSKAIGLPSVELRLLENPDGKKIIAKASGINDRLVFENPLLHRFLFEQLRWTEEEAKKTGDGLYVRTLELSAPEAVGFKLLRNHSLVQALNLFGLSEVVAKKARDLSLSSSAVGAVFIDGQRDENFLTAGRLVQRAWLETTRLGLSFHPMTGIAFLIQRVLAGETKDLSSDNINRIRKAHEMILSVFGTESGTPAMLFRIGHSDPPAARSLRLPLERVAKNL